MIKKRPYTLMPILLPKGIFIQFLKLFPLSIYKKLFFLLFLPFFLCSCSSKKFEKKNYIVGFDRNWYPLNLAGKEQNMVGFTTELFFAISKEEGFTFRLVSTSSSLLFEGLRQHEFDGIISAMIQTSKNTESFLFSDPFYVLGPVLVLKKDSKIESIRDIENKIVGVLDMNSFIFAFEENPPFLIKPYESRFQILSDLNDGLIDAAVLSSLSANLYVTRTKDPRFRLIKTPLTEEGLRLISENNFYGEVLTKKFNQGLQKLKEEGTYQFLLDKWDLINTEKEIEKIEENS